MWSPQCVLQILSVFWVIKLCFFKTCSKNVQGPSTYPEQPVQMCYKEDCVSAMWSAALPPHPCICYPSVSRGDWGCAVSRSHVFH
ncbi:hypothetical protein FKM82_000360 [Ascaphus truei]